MNNAWTPVEQDKEWFPKAKWLDRHAGHVAPTQRDGINVLFLGDSITEGWVGVPDIWQREFAPLGAANYGISGDETQHVLWRLQNGAVAGLNPKVLSLLIGTNNIGNSRHTAAETIQGIRAVVADLRRRLPATRILLHAIFPRDRHADTEFRRTIATVNTDIATLADNQHILWFDIGSIFLEPDGFNPGHVMVDALHLAPEGYARWAVKLAPELRRLLAL